MNSPWDLKTTRQNDQMLRQPQKSLNQLSQVNEVNESYCVDAKIVPKERMGLKSHHINKHATPEMMIHWIHLQNGSHGMTKL